MARMIGFLLSLSLMMSGAFAEVIDSDVGTCTNNEKSCAASAGEQDVVDLLQTQIKVHNSHADVGEQKEEEGEEGEAAPGVPEAIELVEKVQDGSISADSGKDGLKLILQANAPDNEKLLKTLKDFHWDQGSGEFLEDPDLNELRDSLSLSLSQRARRSNQEARMTNLEQSMTTKPKTGDVWHIWCDVNGANLAQTERISGNGANYRGCQQWTTDGRRCQKWKEHERKKYRGKGLGNHNYCRNPDGDSTIWCYTVEPIWKGERFRRYKSWWGHCAPKKKPTVRL